MSLGAAKIGESKEDNLVSSGWIVSKKGPRAIPCRMLFRHLEIMRMSTYCY
jgi:hypothetical protein